MCRLAVRAGAEPRQAERDAPANRRVRLQLAPGREPQHLALPRRAEGEDVRTLQGDDGAPVCIFDEQHGEPRLTGGVQLRIKVGSGGEGDAIREVPCVGCGGGHGGCHGDIG